MSAGPQQDMPIITVKPERDEATGTYRVMWTMSNIQTEAQALRVAGIITAMTCGEEVQFS